MKALRVVLGIVLVLAMASGLWLLSVVWEATEAARPTNTRAARDGASAPGDPNHDASTPERLPRIPRAPRPTQDDADQAEMPEEREIPPGYILVKVREVGTGRAVVGADVGRFSRQAIETEFSAAGGLPTQVGSHSVPDDSFPERPLASMQTDGAGEALFFWPMFRMSAVDESDADDSDTDDSNADGSEASVAESASLQSEMSLAEEMYLHVRAAGYVAVSHEVEPGEDEIHIDLDKPHVADLHVCDEAGGPVPGARIWVYRDSQLPRAALRADGAGLCRFPAVSGTTEELLVIAPGFAWTLRSVYVTSETPAPIYIRMPRAVTLAGSVVDSGGRAVAGASLEIHASDVANSPSLLTLTDPSGSFVVPHLPNTTATVAAQVSAEGYLPVSKSLRLGTPARIVLGSGARIAGRVLLEGSLDPEAASISWETPTGYDSALLQADGTFVLTDASSGRGSLSFYWSEDAEDDEEPRIWTGRTEFDLAEGESREGVELLVESTARSYLRVRVERSSGAAVDGAELVQSRPSTSGGDDWDPETGTLWLIFDAPPGTAVDLTVQCGYSGLRAGELTGVQTRPWPADDVLQVVLPDSYRVVPRFRLADGSTLPADVEPDIDTSSGLHWEAEPEATDEAPFEGPAPSDTLGRDEIDPDAPEPASRSGPLALLVDPPALLRGVVPGVGPFSMTITEEMAAAGTVDVHVQPRTQLRGRIVPESVWREYDVSLTLAFEPEPGSESPPVEDRGASLGTGGEFEFDTVHPLPFRLTLHVDGLARHVLRGTLQAGQTLDLGDVAVLPALQLTGRVTLPDGSPAAGASIHFAETKTWVASWARHAGPDGTFAGPWCEGLAGTLIAYAPGYSAAVAQLVDQREPVVVRLAQESTLRVTTTASFDTTGSDCSIYAWLEGAEVDVVELGAVYEQGANLGEFLVRGLPPVPLRITVEGYGARTGNWTAAQVVTIQPGEHRALVLEASQD